MKMVRLLLTLFAAVAASLVVGEVAKDCSAFSNCLSCTNTSRYYDRPVNCRWCAGSCRDTVSATLLCSADAIVRYDDMCAVAPEPPSPYLANWMGENMDVIGGLSLLDLSLPGSHDTLTYDLTTRVSDGGIDSSPELARILHDYAAIVPDGIEDFIRQQAETHDLTITQQLENGIRFFDFRIMYEYSDKDHADWYSLHCVQSNHLASKYLSEINDFLNTHTNEVVVLWLSKHGSTCAVGNEAYPNVTAEIKQAYWASIVELFGDKMVDFTQTHINSTSLKQMVDSNQRVVIYASDYVEFTGGAAKPEVSKYALDGCLIDNRLSPGTEDMPTALAWQRDVYSHAQQIIDAGKPDNKFLLVSLASGGGGNVPIMFSLRFFKREIPDEVAKCAATYNIPRMTWCPETLLDQSQLQNYYNQKTMEEAVTVQGYRLPNAIYINGVDKGGLVRTGTQTLWGAVRNADDSEHAQTGYAYVDTFIFNNLQFACANGSNKMACAKRTEFVQTRRAKHPELYWDDAAHGRIVVSV